MSIKTTGAEEILWDLSDLYQSPDDPKLEQEISSSLEGAAAFREKYHGKVASLNAMELFEAVSEYERLSEAMTRAADYAGLLFTTDTADPARGALYQKAQEKFTALSAELLFFNLEWIAVPDEAAQRLLADPALEKYRHFLEAMRRYRPYVLSEPEEKILTEKRITANAAWVRLFSELVAALKVNIDGAEASFEEAMSLLHKPDREVRRRAAEAITQSLEPGIRTRLNIFNTLLSDKAIDDRLRGYPHWLASRNLDNEASDEAVKALIDAVVSRYDIPQRYYRIKANILGLDKLADWDRNAPISSEETFTTWDEARKIVIESYEDFSPVAGKIISDFFEKSWIDAAVSPNKESGAYCATMVPGVHPYVFMNYTGERRSILTLAHELGHGLHGALAQDRGLLNADTPLTLAETASVFGEALTFKKLMAGEKDPAMRLDLINAHIEDAVATVFRQIAMNRFEDGVHNTRRSSGELSPDGIAELWTSTQEEMLGEAVELSDGYRSVWWSYIPHFIGSPGYVYAYAFGFLFSLAIFNKYEEEGEPMVEPYLELLAAGGSDTPEALAKIVGLDLSDPGFWTGGLESIDGLLKQAEELAAKR
jgi:oligoendopeptidase F